MRTYVTYRAPHYPGHSPSSETCFLKSWIFPGGSQGLDLPALRGHEGEDGRLQTRHGLREALAALPAPPPGMRRKPPGMRRKPSVSAGPAALTGVTCPVVLSDEIFQDVKMTAPGHKGVMIMLFIEAMTSMSCNLRLIHQSPSISDMGEMTGRTCSPLPSTSYGLAFVAPPTSSTVACVADPKPLESLVFGSPISLQSVSIPHCPEWLLRLSSVVSKLSPPMTSFHSCLGSLGDSYLDMTAVEAGDFNDAYSVVSMGREPTLGF
ncbi:hypothetical protein Celaphus_00012900 [Cervus elaphus hippelaphus]|uniref:Uncharacterized protein n=1 Tax=Cervus elaphus hippelaphus TaxID=46360 RepID=A0A212CIQ3_CEREH|nr:hypothetical protein Celaphus_00012900 [Cervus elaphus hippelaphus]